MAVYLIECEQRGSSKASSETKTLSRALLFR